MKSLRVLLGVALVLSLVAVMTGSAAAVSTYTAGFQVQNLTSSTATIVVSYYNRDGSKNVSDVSTTVPANGSKTFYPIAANSGFDGSVVVSSDQKVAAIVNVLGDGGKSAASYDGSSAGGTTVLLPLLMYANGGYNTWYNVQNAGSSDATVNVTYSDGKTASATIKSGAAAKFDQTTEGHAAKWVGSATLTSNQPVVAAVMEVGTSILFAYSGFSGGATSPVMPLINANNSGYQTGAQLQNAGSAATTVTVSYKASTGTDCTETQTIPAGQSKTFALYAFAGVAQTGMTTTCTKAKFIGSAKVTANSASQPLVAIVNQLGSTQGEAYGSFDSAAATGTVVMPLIMDRNSGYFTGFSVVNVGPSATSVNCTFTSSSVTASTASLAPDAAFVHLQNGVIANGYVGSATCTAGSGGKIIGVVNELGSTAGADQLLVYEAINN
jgi:hypothetical protein